MSILHRAVWFAVFIGALVGGWMFAGSNAAPVRVDYLIGEFAAVPLWIALVTSFGLGGAAMALSLFARLTRSSLAQRRYRKTLAALESEVHQLRNLPVEGGRDTIPIAEATPELSGSLRPSGETPPPVEAVR